MPLKNIFNADNEHDEKKDQLAIAILLFRLIRSDGQSKMVELIHMSEMLRRDFNLSQEELEVVFKQASNEESNVSNTSDFTKQACANLSKQKRIKLLEYLWVLVFADGNIEDQEIAMVRDTAKELQLSDYDQATAEEKAEKYLGSDLI